MGKFRRPYRSVPILPTTTLDQPTLFYSLNLNLNQLNRLRTRLDRQHRLRTVEAWPTELDGLRLRQVEVEAQSTSLQLDLVLHSEHTLHTEAG